MVDDTPRSRILKLCNHISLLRSAAKTCREKIDQEKKGCTVTVDFENHRIITWQQAEAYADELEKLVGEEIVNVAASHLGEPYSLHDCTHFVHLVYQECGLEYPYINTKYLQKTHYFQQISRPKAGDIVLLGKHEPGSKELVPQHVGIYTRGDKIISAQSGEGKVLENTIPYFRFQLKLLGYYRWYQFSK